MSAVTRRAAAFVALFLLVAPLAACGDNEPEQRKAFMAFLKTRIVDRPGVHVPMPNDEDNKAFGPYTTHYKVITDFVGNSELIAMSKTMSEALPPLRSFKDIIDKRADIKLGGERLSETIKLANGKLAEAEKARAALKQPDDLKVVYDAAFDKTVIKPMQGFNEARPIVLDIIGDAVKLADYVAAHADKIKIVGNSPQTTDRKTQAEFNALATALTANTTRFNDAQRRLRIVLSGS